MISLTNCTLKTSSQIDNMGKGGGDLHISILNSQAHAGVGGCFFQVCCAHRHTQSSQ